MRVSAAVLVCALVCGCQMHPLPGPGNPQTVVEHTVTEAKNLTATRKSLRDVLKAYPVEVRQSVADTLAALAQYIGQGHTTNTASAFRLVTRAFADHPVLSAQPMPEVAAVVNTALKPYSDPKSVPKDWAAGMGAVLQELAVGAAQAAK